ncbi:hypothetical protein AMTR_s00074p00032520 [Amborella trichopoda]|uniref:Uncharacterized protein n=1 Tax=Amborella trichopoda TaxID=13333 RepID=W1NMU4_AMBTC|nr:hypothetical protein AMTR_s00074p00032520 [Amborella trichopoda]
MVLLFQNHLVKKGRRVVKGRKHFIYKKKLANTESNKFKILENLEDYEGASTSLVLKNKEHAGVITAAMVAEREEQSLGGWKADLSTTGLVGAAVALHQDEGNLAFTASSVVEDGELDATLTQSDHMLKHGRVNLEGIPADVQFQVMVDVAKLPQATGTYVIEVRCSNVPTQDAKLPLAKGATAADIPIVQKLLMLVEHGGQSGTKRHQ